MAADHRHSILGGRPSLRWPRRGRSTMPNSPARLPTQRDHPGMRDPHPGQFTDICASTSCPLPRLSMWTDRDRHHHRRADRSHRVTACVIYDSAGYRGDFRRRRPHRPGIYHTGRSCAGATAPSLAASATSTSRTRTGTRPCLPTSTGGAHRVPE